MGVSGWKYAGWRGDFYPEGLVQRRELEYVASRMSSVELNASFYSLRRPSTYQQIHDQTPDDFVVAVKGSRFITHLRRLREVDVGLANFLASGVLALGPKLGPLLWQLPATLAYDGPVLADFLGGLPRTTADAAALARRHDDKVAPDESVTDATVDQPLRHALEPRHPSFGEPAAVDLLRDHDVALVTSDSPGAWPCFEERTTGFRYVRLHGHTELYASGYAAASLDRWSERIRRWTADGQDVFVYFDNDARGRAPHDAVALLERLTGASRPPVRR